MYKIKFIINILVIPVNHRALNILTESREMELSVLYQEAMNSRV